MELRSASALHLLQLRYRNASPHTLLSYEMVQRRFCDWLDGRLGRPATIADLTAPHVRDFAVWLKAEHVTLRPGNLTAVGHGAKSLQQHVGALKSLATYLTDHEGVYPKGNPLATLKVPRAPSLEVPRFSEREVTLLVSLCSETRYPLRNRAIILFLVESGVRVSELCDLQTSQLELATTKRQYGRARVMGKGQKQRFVYFGLKASQAVHRYLADPLSGRPASSSPYLFLVSGARQLTRGAVDDLIRKLGQAAGIELVRCSAHTFRHTFATQYLRRNPGQLLQLQQLLGHSTLHMVQHYARIATQDVEDSYRSAVDSWQGIK